MDTDYVSKKDAVVPTYIFDRLNDISCYADKVYDISVDELIEQLKLSVSDDTAQAVVTNKNVNTFKLATVNTGVVLSTILASSREVKGFFERIVQKKDPVLISDIVLLICRMYDPAHRPDTPTSAFISLEKILRLTPDPDVSIEPTTIKSTAELNPAVVKWLTSCINKRGRD
jgi:hypothetical protein